MDVTPPPLREVFVLGELMFEDQRDYNFTANLVGVRVCGGLCVRVCGMCGRYICMMSQ